MEIILLLVLWVIAAFAAEERSFGFSLFLVFSSLGFVAWRWRGKLDELRQRFEIQTQALENVRSELRDLAQELRRLRAGLVTPAHPQAEPLPAAEARDLTPQ